MKTLLAIAFLALTACASGPVKHETVLEADGAMVANCEFRGSVSGHTMWGGPLGSATGIVNAKKEAMDEAADAGATHVMLTVDGGGWNGTPTVNGQAYFCPG